MKILLTIIIALLLSVISVNAGNNNGISTDQKEQARHWMKNKPVQFSENRGQLSDNKGNPVPFVLFKASAPGVDLYVTEKGLTYTFIKVEEEYEREHEEESFIHESEKIKMEYSRIDMDLKEAIIKRENIIKETPSVTDFNYFYPHCAQGVYGIKQYEKITIRNIYPNIDWVLYNSTKKGFKYDFIIHPGGDPKKIKLLYRSENKVEMDKDGSLVIKTPMGTLTENAPVSYLQENEKSISSSFTKQPVDEYTTEITFRLSGLPAGEAGFPTDQSLIIDPQLAWSTFYGGNGLDGPTSADCDVIGNIYVTGYSASANFPTQTWGTAYFNGTMSGQSDIAIVKFSNSGAMIWSTFYGGSDLDYGFSIAVNPTGNIYIAGYTASSNFPTQAGTGALSGAYYDPTLGGGGIIFDAFVLRFLPTGGLEWATYYGGSGSDYCNSMVLDATGNIYLCGITSSTDFPTQTWGPAYLDGTLGGTHDAFMVRFSAAGTCDWATYYGGSGIEGDEIAPGFVWGPSCITSDASGNIYVTGVTSSTDFPKQAWGSAYFDNTLGGASDLFILRFSATGNCDWATYYGGSAKEYSGTILPDGSGNIYLTGWTLSADFPIQAWGTAYTDGTLGGTDDAFILHFSAAGNCDWSTYYGGTNREYWAYLISTNDNIEIDNCGNIYISFETLSADIQTLDPGCGFYYDGVYSGSTGPYSAGDIFLVKFNNTGQLLWATYIGGISDDYRSPLALDANNNLFLCGEWGSYTSGSSLPFIDPGSGAYFDSIPNGADDSFIMKFIPIQPVYASSQVNPGACTTTCNGSATVSISCAMVPLNYKWSNGSSTLNTTNLNNTISNLCAGNYWVEITDASCNKDTVFYTLSGNNGLTINTNVSNISCTGATTGSALVNVSTGTAPYTYAWSTGASTSAVTGLIAGTYTITVTDSNGCDSTQIITVSNPVLPSIVLSTPTNVLCNGFTTGSATVTVSSGTSPYTYAWSNAQSTSAATGLGAANYTVIVTDSNGCDSTLTMTIAQPPALTPILTFTTSTCGKNNGTASISAGGGTPGYMYTWNIGPVQTTATVTGLGTGNYIVTITDANNCTQTSSVSIAPSSSPAVSLAAQVNAACNGGNTGSATIIASAGTLPYTYLWNTIPVQNTATGNGLIAGSYTCTVTDAIGCTGSQTVLISQPAILIAGTSHAPDTCLAHKGTVSANPNGGTPAYTYSWNNGQATQTATGLVAGTYTVIIADANNCSNSATVTVTDAPCPCPKNLDISVPNAFSPNGDGENDKFCLQGDIGKCIKELTIIIYNRWGEEIYKSQDTRFCWEGSYKDEMQNSIVVVYYLKVVFIDNAEVIKMGNISLIK